MEKKGNIYAPLFWDGEKFFFSVKQVNEWTKHYVFANGTIVSETAPRGDDWQEVKPATSYGGAEDE